MKPLETSCWLAIIKITQLSSVESDLTEFIKLLPKGQKVFREGLVSAEFRIVIWYKAVVHFGE